MSGLPPEATTGIDAIEHNGEVWVRRADIVKWLDDAADGFDRHVTNGPTPARALRTLARVVFMAGPARKASPAPRHLTAVRDGG